MRGPVRAKLDEMSNMLLALTKFYLRACWAILKAPPGATVKMEYDDRNPGGARYHIAYSDPTVE